MLYLHYQWTFCVYLSFTNKHPSLLRPKSEPIDHRDRNPVQFCWVRLKLEATTDCVSHSKTRRAGGNLALEDEL